jgi:2-keto-4-pentenoate hydratase/2-oxohepta-3-ene-1,7-dioic acid hydratase in catechol pathway
MKIICIGRNYTNHIEELKNERPTEPVVYEAGFGRLLKQHPFVIPEFEDVHTKLKLSKLAK